MGSLKDRCRVCFKEQSSDERKLLFSDDGKELVIAGKLSHILGTAALKPRQPDTVCVTCAAHVDFCLQFVSRARRVHDHIESGSDIATIQTDIQYRYPVLDQDVEAVRTSEAADFFETAGSFFSNVPSSMLEPVTTASASTSATVTASTSSSKEDVDFIVEVEPNDFFADNPLTSPNRVNKPEASSPKKVRRILPRPTQDQLIQVKQQTPAQQQVMIPITLKTPCKLCGVMIVASSMQELKNHVCCGVMAETAVNPLCLEGGCKKAFSSKHSLRAHQRNAHGMHKKTTVQSASGKQRNKFACGFEGCTKSYSNMTYLTEHERVHTGERPFSCGNCAKSFYRILDLKKHKLLKVCK